MCEYCDIPEDAEFADHEGECDWTPWHPSPINDLREDRFCRKCGDMESQTLVLDQEDTEPHTPEGWFVPEGDKRCGHKPGNRKGQVVCQLPVGHEGSHRSVQGYWLNDDAGLARERRMNNLESYAYKDRWGVRYPESDEDSGSVVAGGFLTQREADCFIDGYRAALVADQEDTDASNNQTNEGEDHGNDSE